LEVLLVRILKKKMFVLSVIILMITSLLPFQAYGAPNDTKAPTAPTNLAVSSVTTNSADLYWTASTDNVGVTGYDVYKASVLVGSTTGGTSFTVTGLSSNVTYSFTVKAKDAAGNISASSSALNVTTSGSVDTTAPTAPTNLIASAATYNSVTLSWAASTDNVAVSGYDIFRATVLIGSTSGATSFNVTNLDPSTMYSFTVKAKDAAGNISTASNAVSVTTSPQPAGTGYKAVAYYTSWSTYKRNYQVTAIPASKITHINYAFADICWNGIHGNSDPTGPNPNTWTCQDEKANPINVPNGTIVIGDVFADATKSFTGDVYNQPLKGNFNQLNKLKQANPNLKTIISVGGWSWSNRFSDVAADPIIRSTFAKSAVDFLRKYGFDGIDLDWEYPVADGLAGNSYRPEDKTNYTLLLQAIRQELDAAGAQDLGKHYLLTIAAGAGTNYMNNTELDKIAQTVDWINLMTYDYHGGFEPRSGHNAPLYFDSNDSLAANSSFNVDASVTGFLAHGVPGNKLVMGVPFYGRGWDGCANINNGQYQTCTGASRAGTWEGGVFDFSDLEANYININGKIRYWNDITKTPFLFNDRGQFISYDDAESMKFKTDYIKSKGLAGSMIWELSADRNQTLLNVISTQLPK
jgi:chitinase